MSKAAKCMQMLQILRSGRTYKSEALAALLQTNPRNVAEYRKELNGASEIVQSITGKNGGYRLVVPSQVPMVRLTSKEAEALSSAIDSLSQADHPAAKTLNAVSSSLNASSFLLNPPIVSEAERGTYEFLEDAVHARHAVTLSLLDGETVNLSPIELSKRGREYGLLAFDMKEKRMRTFALSAIREVALSPEAFVFPPEEFRASRGFDVAFDAAGISIGALCLLLPGNAMTLRGKAGHLHAKATFDNQYEALEFFLGHPEFRVVSPSSLVERIKRALEETIHSGREAPAH